MPAPTALTRRRLLLGAAGGLASTALPGCRGGVQVQEDSGTLQTTHWPGVSPTWRMLKPDGAKGLVIALHGVGLTGPKMIDFLEFRPHVERTQLAVAAISGGNTYWHKRRDGSDTGALVTEDFLPFALQKCALPASAKVAFLGLSMGGYGSLLLASELGPKRVFGVVAESAALWTEPGLSAPGAFDDREDFLAHDVFARGKALRDIPIRIDCGITDPFADANRVFVDKVVPHAKATFDSGGHTGDYWREHAGVQMDWLAGLLKPDTK